MSSVTRAPPLLSYTPFCRFYFFFFFFFNDTATTEIYTLSLHDALPILLGRQAHPVGREPDLVPLGRDDALGFQGDDERRDRKSTRLNSSHGYISYAVFCLKKKKKETRTHRRHYDKYIHLQAVHKTQLQI